MEYVIKCQANIVYKIEADSEEEAKDKANTKVLEECMYEADGIGWDIDIINSLTDNVYYVIYTTSIHHSKKCPSYLQLVNDGRMIQSNFYDASKYNSIVNAKKELQATNLAFKGAMQFEIIPVDKRIFGETPRWVED